MLQITLTSFSYQKGIPAATHEHGQGFVFDCRGIENPGLIPELAMQTGEDKDVQLFLEEKTEMPTFLKSVESLVFITVDKFLERGFANLNINFGCTGGRHRSVYTCEMITKRIRTKYTNLVSIHKFHTNLPFHYKNHA